jgi:hypothetical protein
MTGRTATPKSSVADTAAYAASAASSAKSGAKVAVSFHSLLCRTTLISRPAQLVKDQPSSPVKEMSNPRSSNSPTRSVSSLLSYLPLFDH